MAAEAQEHYSRRVALLPKARAFVDDLNALLARYGFRLDASDEGLTVARFHDADAVLYLEPATDGAQQRYVVNEPMQPPD